MRQQMAAGGQALDNRQAPRRAGYPEVQNAMPGHEIVWAFTVASEQRAAFEAAYGTAGPWADLFRRAAGFIETRLLCDLDCPGHYLTIDRWSSKEAFLAFERDFSVAYARLDRELEGTSESERRVGVFAVVGE